MPYATQQLPAACAAYQGQQAAFLRSIREGSTIQKTENGRSNNMPCCWLRPHPRGCTFRLDESARRMQRMKQEKRKTRSSVAAPERATETGTTGQLASTSTYNDTITCRSGQSIVGYSSITDSAIRSSSCFWSGESPRGGAVVGAISITSR